jgi:hypothetical protein
MKTRLLAMLGVMALVGAFSLLGGCTKPAEPEATPAPPGGPPAGLPGSATTDDGKSAMPAGGPPK